VSGDNWDKKKLMFIFEGFGSWGNCSRCRVLDFTSSRLFKYCQNAGLEIFINRLFQVSGENLFDLKRWICICRWSKPIFNR